MKNHTAISMIKCADMNEAIEMHDRNSEHGFYDSYENERASHDRYYRKYPAMAAQWLYCETDGNVYKISKFQQQRIINKHSLTTSLSCGNLDCLIATEYDAVFIFAKTVNAIPKSNKQLRDDWCRADKNHFLTGDL